MGEQYEFGPFVLDLPRRELRRHGEVVDLQARVLDLIAYLIQRQDRVVGKEELIAAVWSGTVVTDAVLTSAVRKARIALQHQEGDADLIKTVHGRGYRFTGVASAVPSLPLPQAVEERDGSLRRPTITVLPFASPAEDPDQTFFADAVAADITTLLAKHRWLEVVRRQSVRLALGEPPADYLVSGTVRRMGNRLRVTAELSDGRSGRHLWGDIYDRRVAELFDVQDEITRTVVGRLEPEIGQAERHKVARARHPDLRAWECYHLALLHFYRFTAEDNAEARRLLQRSRELDPAFGEAHAWWAYATVLGMVYWDEAPDQRLLDDALDATQRALQLDDRNALFYALKARVQLARGEYDSAIAENDIAIRLNPTLALAHCSLGDSLAYEGRYDDAVGHFQVALTLSPNDPQRWAFFSYGALALLFKGEFQQALHWVEQALEIPNCQYWALAHRAVALAYLDRREELPKAAAALRAAKPEFTRAFARRKLFYLKRRDQIELYLDGLTRAGIPAA